MNRTEQTAEPTMEEILASIRLIISDDSKKAPPAREDPPAPMPEAAAPLNALPAEDVLDLTDELVFPEEGSAPAMTSSAAANSSHFAAGDAPGEEPSNERPDLTAAPSQPSQAAEMPQAAPYHIAPPEAPHDFAQRPAPAPSRTIWSRRELPGSTGPVAAAAPRFSQDAAPSRQPKSWAQDVQMAISDRGPISLIPGQIQAQKPEPEEARPSSGDAEEEIGVALSSGLGDKEEAGVAALTEDLIRTAVSAMDAEELATAADIDFGEIDGGRKAEVTERVAAAIQREHEARDTSPLPTLLNEMRRQDYLNESERLSEPDDRSGPDDRSTDAEAPASARDDSLGAYKPRFDFAWDSSTETASQSEEIAPVPSAPVLQASEAPAQQRRPFRRSQAPLFCSPYRRAAAGRSKTRCGTCCVLCSCNG